MARNRMIKPEFFSSKKLGQVSIESTNLFIGLWVFADDYGVYLYTTRKILGDVYPYRESVTEKNICEWLDELIKIGVITVADVEDKKYIIIINWKEHQMVSHPSSRRYLSDSKISEIIELHKAKRDSPESLQRVSRESPESLQRVSRESPALKKKEKEKEKEERNTVCDSDEKKAEEIYNLYPSKDWSGRSTNKSRKNDIVKIKKLINEGIDLKGLIEKYDYECRRNKVYMKNLKTFLNNLPDYSEAEQDSGWGGVIYEPVTEDGFW